MIGCHCCPCSNGRRSERWAGTWSCRRRRRCVWRFTPGHQMDSATNDRTRWGGGGG